MERQSLGEVMDLSMTKMKEMLDVNTVIGDPVYTPDGITIIPVSQVSMGLANGGGSGGNGMGTGMASGVKMFPLGFLVIKDGMVRFVSTKAPADTTIDRVLDMIPDLFDRAERLVENLREKKDETEA